MSSKESLEGKPRSTNLVKGQFTGASFRQKTHKMCATVTATATATATAAATATASAAATGDSNCD